MRQDTSQNATPTPDNGALPHNPDPVTEALQATLEAWLDDPDPAQLRRLLLDLLRDLDG